MNILKVTRLIVFGAALVAATQASVAGEADVVSVTVSKGGQGIYNFDVTVKHADTGWEHYADKWDIVGPNGKLLGTRVLFHPHESEQPFTRSLSGVRISDDIKAVTVRAHDKVHAYGGKEMSVKIER